MDGLAYTREVRGRYVVRFAAGNFSAGLPGQTRAGLPRLSVYSDFIMTVTTYQQPIHFQATEKYFFTRVSLALLNTFTASKKPSIQDDCEEGKSNKKCLR